jgi:Ni/Fe-hydrogenase subunit HybB-like protein
MIEFCHKIWGLSRRSVLKSLLIIAIRGKSIVLDSMRSSYYNQCKLNSYIYWNRIIWWTFEYTDFYIFNVRFFFENERKESQNERRMTRRCSVLRGVNVKCWMCPMPYFASNADYCWILAVDTIKYTTKCWMLNHNPNFFPRLLNVWTYGDI